MKGLAPLCCRFRGEGDGTAPPIRCSGSDVLLSAFSDGQVLIKCGTLAPLLVATTTLVTGGVLLLQMELRAFLLGFR